MCNLIFKNFVVFINCEYLIFLYNYISDVRQLTRFTEMWSYIVEEEPFNMNRLSYLHSVVTGFAALIYDLPIDADFKTFNDKCTIVRSFLMKNTKLEVALVRLRS